MAPSGDVRQAVRDHVAAGDVTGPADLGRRLRADGLEVAPDELRRHLRALGTLRVEGPEGPLLAVPVERAERPVRERSAPAETDPDRAVQLTVAVVALAFLALGLLGWLLA